LNSSIISLTVQRPQLDKCHVADLVQTDQDAVIENTFGQPALHHRAGPFGDVKTRERVFERNRK
jgi:hypothetical protein